MFMTILAQERVGSLLSIILKPLCDSLVIAINVEVLGCLIVYALKIL